ncbi:MAG TPA: hypothetical protein PKZ76_04710 [Xanthomonadaceae bacterium]|nr:hypothetical protein [Xanthomonadaceae bacterium]
MIRSALCAALLLALVASVQAASFTYRGHIEDGGMPAEGRYDLKLTLHADRAGTHTLAAPIELGAIEVRQGDFAVGLAFDDLPEHLHAGWLEIAIRSADDGGWWSLPDRQPVMLKAQLCPESWALAGNASTSPAANFLGTTDNQPLVLRVNNQAALRLWPNAVTPSLAAGHAANVIGAGVHAATIGGGGDASNPNAVTNAYGTVGGGLGNSVSGNRGTVGGGSYNTVSGDWGVVGGGDSNAATGSNSTVAGGMNNQASGSHSNVDGGSYNIASGSHSTIAGGYSNWSDGPNAIVAGGWGNRAAAQDSFVGGGQSNQSFGLLSGIVGGLDNFTLGFANAVGAGERNCAGGTYSWAGGFRAKVRPASDPGFGACTNLPSYPGVIGDIGSFIWADAEDADFVSTGSNQFLVRAGGGFGINTSSIGFADDLVIAARQGGDADADLLMRTRAGKFARIFLSEANGGLVFGTEGARYSFGAGIDSNRWINTGANGAHLTVGGAWTNGSSRAFKHAFENIDPLDILARVIELPITRWSYRGEGTTRHLGPTAEDFADTFGLGQDPRYISTVDASGVALAAIQGLHARLHAENVELRSALAEQGKALERLQAAFEQMLRNHDPMEPPSH